MKQNQPSVIILGVIALIVFCCSCIFSCIALTAIPGVQASQKAARETGVRQQITDIKLQITEYESVHGEVPESLKSAGIKSTISGDQVNYLKLGPSKFILSIYDSKDNYTYDASAN